MLSFKFHVLEWCACFSFARWRYSNISCVLEKSHFTSCVNNIYLYAERRDLATEITRINGFVGVGMPHDTVTYIPDSKVHGANMGPTWVLSVPDGPHVGPMPCYQGYTLYNMCTDSFVVTLSSLNWVKWFICPYSAWMLYRLWGNCKIGSVSVK